MACQKVTRYKKGYTYINKGLFNCTLEMNSSSVLIVSCEAVTQLSSVDILHSILELQHLDTEGW